MDKINYLKIAGSEETLGDSGFQPNSLGLKLKWWLLANPVIAWWETEKLLMCDASRTQGDEVFIESSQRMKDEGWNERFAFVGGW